MKALTPVHPRSEAERPALFGEAIMETRTVSVREGFDRTRFRPYQAQVSFLGLSVIRPYGFDGTVIGVALPKIAESLHSGPRALVWQSALAKSGRLSVRSFWAQTDVMSLRCRLRCVHVSYRFHHQCGAAGCMPRAHGAWFGRRYPECPRFRLRIHTEPIPCIADHHDVHGHACRLHDCRNLGFIPAPTLRPAIAHVLKVWQKVL